MSHQQPLQYIWWLVSRASGILALVLISLSVVLGLAMAARVLRGPKLKRAVVRFHEHVALVAIAAIAVHGLALLGDHWLKPGWRGIAIPFAMSYRPGYTGIGIIAGYLAVLLGPSFYLRRRIGARRWRRLHRATVLVWLLAAVHTIGAGTDGATPWLRVVVLVPLPAIVYLGVVRLLGSRSQPARPAGRRPVAGEHDAERGAVSGRRLRGDPASVRFGDRPRDREAESAATAVA
jgi:sulfoxide reductase heme-binding subunit YedZ